MSQEFKDTEPESAPVAVIDVGSNTIKLLIARRSAQGGVETLFLRTCESRISRGISAISPRLTEEGMQVGVEAIESLVADARRHAPKSITIVATSAVRSASNGAEFRDRVKETTGIPLRILSGDEEARLIGRGLACDPALASSGNFYVFDLGGGSMECLAFLNGKLTRALSLPLGCVRLTERFVEDPTKPVDAATLEALRCHVNQSLREAAFAFDLPKASAVFAGGSMTTARAILGAMEGKTLEEAPMQVSVASLTAMLERIAPLSLGERRTAIKGLPPARADVFPAALVTMITSAQVAGVSEFRHSLFNLRYGLAAELLEGQA